MRKCRGSRVAGRRCDVLRTFEAFFLVIALMDIPPRYYKCHCVTVVYALPLTRYWRVLFDEVGLTMCIKALQAVPLTDAPPCCLKSIDISKSNTATS